MKRRGFIKSIAAGIAGGPLVLSKLIAARHDLVPLHLFCMRPHESSRFSLLLPFEQEATTYATDGRVCVRTQMPASDHDATAKLPLAGRLPWSCLDSLSGWRRWPVQDWKAHPTQNNCEHCDAMGVVGDNMLLCPRCDGDSMDSDPFNYKCPTCDNLGYTNTTKCKWCNGTGDADVSMQRVGDLRIAGRYDRRIRQLDDVEFAIIRRKHEGVNQCEGHGPVVFRFDGGEGMLMPLSVD